MRSPGRRAAPRHRAPSVTARARAGAARLLRGADGAAPGAAEARDADATRMGGDGDLRGADGEFPGPGGGAPGARQAAGTIQHGTISDHHTGPGRTGAGWTGAAREGPAESQAGQPGVAQARDDPYLRRWPGRGRRRVPGRQHVPDRAALQRPHPGKPVHVRGLPRPAAARRHAGLGPAWRPHHAQRPLRVRPGYRAPARDHPSAAGGSGAPQPSVGSQPGVGTQPVSITYQQVEHWPGGFADQITISGLGGTGARSWSLAFGYPGSRIAGVQGGARAGSRAAPGREWPGGSPGPAGGRCGTPRARYGSWSS